MSRKSFFIILGVLFVLFLQFAATGYAEAPLDIKEGWNELWHELMIDLLIIGIIFAVSAIYLLIKYKRKSPNEEGSAKKLSPLAAFGWVVIPVFVFMADDIYLAAKSFELWGHYRNVPPNALVINVEGYMWGWDVKYPERITTTNELRVPAGRPVKVRLTSRDVVHSFFIPDYRVKWDTVKGRENYIWFYPKKVGEHVMTCTEFCGVLHHAMHGKVIVMPENEFNQWVEANKPKEGGAI